jgi:hypothetical protein
MLSIANKLFMLSVMALRQKPLSNQFCHCADECLVFIEMLIDVKLNVVVLSVFGAHSLHVLSIITYL